VLLGEQRWDVLARHKIGVGELRLWVVHLGESCMLIYRTTIPQIQRTVDDVDSELTVLNRHRVTRVEDIHQHW
jgi:hypothetical protein